MATVTKAKRASAGELREMRRLLEAVREDPNPKTMAEVLARRPWLKRGIAAVEEFGLIENCPQAERPYWEFFDTIHTAMHQKMVSAASDRMRGDSRFWLDYMARLWRSEYGKWEAGQQGGNVVLVIDRPPREG
jgi:hypothetical protein